MNYEKLYEESISFRLYVDKVCKQNKIDKETAFKDAIVRSYAEYVVNDQPANAKEDIIREYRQNCGC